MFRAEQKIGQYTLIKHLGKGGFGEVWLAERRTKFVTTKVAVKLPLDEQVDHAAIKQEAEMWERASGHPNVLPIIEADEYDGQVIIVSEFAPDGSLEDLLKKNDGSLPVKQALEMTIGILSGLEFLHSRNIIHRDIKPANVLLQGDTPRLADFGISRVMKVTAVSLNIAGTPNYMAPEAFDRKRNAQTDVWSVGVMFYQMLTGKLPFQQDSFIDLMTAIALREPEPPPANIPPVLREIIIKALKKQPLERYKTAFDIKKDLHNFLYGKASRLELGTTQTIENATVKIPTVSFNNSEKKTIAILPFKNLNGDPTSQFYEFSLADAVTTELARLCSLIVRPSSVIAKYQGRDIDPREAGKEMLVSSILSAGFIHSGERMRVTAQLLDVLTGDIIWSDRIDLDASDIFAVQDIITERILNGLEFDLSTSEQQCIGQRPTRNNDAYEEYLHGRDRMRRYIYQTNANVDIETAIEHFKRAIELDSKFALAFCALGSCYLQRVFKGLGNPEDIADAQDALDKGLALDSQIIEARASRTYLYFLQGEKQKAREQIANLRREAPHNSFVHFLSGVLYRQAGDYENSLHSWKEMLRVDPTARVVVCYNRARIFMYQQRYEDAFSELKQAAVLEPNYPIVKFFYAVAIFRSGDPAKAADLLRDLLANHPRDIFRPYLAMCLSALGEHEAALDQLTEGVKKVAATDSDVSYWLASAYLMENQRDEALKWLEYSINLGNENHPWFESNPIWKPLHNDSQFKKLMRQIETGDKLNRSL